MPLCSGSCGMMSKMTKIIVKKLTYSALLTKYGKTCYIIVITLDHEHYFDAKIRTKVNLFPVSYE